MNNVIEIENLWKEYRLGVISHGTLTRDLQSWWAKLRGKEDPNSKIQLVLSGQEKQIEGEHFWALRDINLQIKQGELIGLIGKNGAGKSTLLKILSRITAPTKGQIKIKGRIASLLEVGTGFHPELTGRENIFMNGAILGMSKQEIKRKIDEIINFSGVEQFIDTPVKRYSSGMYVRLAFAIAAHLEPEILIVDEVLAVGDIDFQKKCIEKMEEVSKSGKTVIFVSHNMRAVSELCSECIIVKNGMISFKGPVLKSIERYVNNFDGESNFSHGIKGFLQIKSIEIQNYTLKKEISIEDKIIIVVKYSCNGNGKLISPDINLFNDLGTLIFCSHQIEPIIIDSDNTYVSTCIIPGNLLHPGIYCIDFSLISPEPFKIYAYYEKVCMFKIKETKSEKTARGKLKVNIPGIILPKLDWDTSIEKKDV